MRALTLTQPWCGLMAAGIKPIENRDRKIIRAAAAGERFALHASREIDERVYDRVAEIAPDVASIGVMSGEIHSEWLRLSRVTGAVIAVGTLVTSIVRLGLTTGAESRWRVALGWPALDQIAPDDLRWFFGSIGYVIRDPVVLDMPVPCRGMLGFWTLPPDVEAAVRGQL